MNSLIKKVCVAIKEKIKNWLLADELKEFDNLIKQYQDTVMDVNFIKKEYEDMIKSHKNTMALLNEAQNEHLKSRDIVVNCQKFMNSICDVGTDIGFTSDDHSWAVICIHGKIDYVRFIDMRREDVMSITKFLKNFEYSNRVTDSPLGYKAIFDDMIIKL